jgi:predicted DCC family thiol-disulfide oxidoreductase YuxK
MSDVQREPYSYRSDPDVPPFPDDKPLFVFDGHCVLCSSGASWMMRKCGGKLRFASAQSPLGVALFRHYAIDPDKTYLLIADGESSGESTGYLKLCPILGWPWRLLLIFRLIPRRVRDGAYRIIARNRYQWFGKVDQCALLSDDQKAQMLR